MPYRESCGYELSFFEKKVFFYVMGTIYTGFNIWRTNHTQSRFHWSKLQTHWLSCLLSVIIIFLGEKIDFFSSQQLIKWLKKSPSCFFPVDMKNVKQNFFDGGKYQGKSDWQRKISRKIWMTEENIREKLIDRGKYQGKSDWRRAKSSKNGIDRGKCEAKSDQ